MAESGLSFAAWARQNPQYSNEPAIDGLTRWAQASFPVEMQPSSAAPTAAPWAAEKGMQMIRHFRVALPLVAVLSSAPAGRAA
ncbi:hypothetical protein ACFQU7_30025 [Pseudoroseomonas wenyumeiae]